MKKISLFGLVLLFMAACTTPNKYYYEEGEIFHTYYHIKYEASQPLADTILAELQLFDASLNPFRKGSVIDMVNNNEPVVVDSFFRTVFLQSQHVSQKTDGMFDITCAPLVNLWGFGFENLGKVDSAKVDSLLQLVGYNKVRLLSDCTVQKDDSRIKLNMSAIAKGYSVDVVCQLLERFGVENYMCEIGGEVRTKGVNPKGEPWTIGITKPIQDKSGTVSELQTAIELGDMSVATSGDYRNYYYGDDGKKYAHTINPQTGYPAQQNILSATVVANDCMTADAFATAFMAMGLERAKLILAENPELSACFIFDGDGTFATYCSEGFRKMMK